MAVKGETARVLRAGGPFSAQIEIVTRSGEQGLVTILTHERGYVSGGGLRVSGCVTCAALEPEQAIEVARGLLVAAGVDVDHANICGWNRL